MWFIITLNNLKSFEKKLLTIAYRLQVFYILPVPNKNNDEKFTNNIQKNISKLARLAEFLQH